MTFTTTPWFAPYERPVRSGPYEIQTNNMQLMFSFYDTETGVWGYNAYTPAGATGMRGKPSVNQRKTWRGIVR